VEDAREVGPAVRRALQAVEDGTPALVDCVTAFR
jgi:hypothetical protein